MDGENFMENPINKWMIWGENPLFLVQHQYLPIYIYIVEFYQINGSVHTNPIWIRHGFR